MKKIYIGRRLDGECEIGGTKVGWNPERGFSELSYLTSIENPKKLQFFTNIKLKPGQVKRYILL